ncbi:MAG TPA: DUF368 domain-containing protein [Thermoplasmatales archaeon]|nr:DUF368 domain-containing protein [Thermoplasmatales archaeon]
MKESTGKNKPLILFLKGLLMGSADIIPGISGGTIALITGIYDDLVFTIKSIDPRFLVYPFLALYKRDYLKMAKKTFFSIDFKFLLPLVSGITTAFLILAQIIHFMLANYDIYVYSFFLGLIIASAAILYIRMEKRNLLYLIPLTLGILLAYVFLSLSEIQLNHSLPVIFVSGIVSICAMILPGISGAFIMLLLGQYNYMINALKSFSVIPITVYLSGAVMGIISFSHVLSFLIKRYRFVTLSFLIGIMIGGLKRPLDRLLICSNLFSVSTILSISIGMFMVIGVEYLYKKREEKWRGRSSNSQ